MAKWNLDVLVDSNEKITKLREYVTKKLDELYRFRETQCEGKVWISADTDREIRTYEVIWGMIR